MHSHTPRIAYQNHAQVAEEAISLQREVDHLRAVLEAIMEVDCRSEADSFAKVRELASGGLRRVRIDA